MGQLLDSGQTTWARATGSALPIFGNAYNAVSGEDLLTGRQLSMVEQWASGFALGADVAFSTAGAMKLYARYSGKSSYLISSERVARYRAKVQDLLNKGFGGKRPAELAELSGRIDMMERGFLKLGHGKYDGVRGIDGVYRRFGSNPEIAILESKWRLKWSAGRDPETILGRGYGFDQMSPEWIRAVADRLEIAGRPEMANAAMRYHYRLINVLDGSGNTYVHWM